MKLLLPLITYTCCAVGFTAAQAIFDSPCPALVAASNFNISAYLGRWYEIQRYEMIAGEKGDCVVATFAQGNDAGTFFARQEVTLLPNVTHKVVSNGTLRLSDLAASPPVGHLIANFGGNDSNYLVLNTDYTSYALVWSCENLAENRSQRMLDLLTLIVPILC